MPESARIRLRPIASSDTDDILRWRNSEGVMRQFLLRTPITRETHEQWLIDQVGGGRVKQFIIIDEKNSGIGSVYLRDVDLKNRKAELGIFIGEDAARGRGYGLEAVRAIMKYGFQTLSLHRIYLRVLESNERAISVYKRAGFIVEGTARDDALIDGEYRSVVWMAALRKDDGV